jgi:hypothetical protein
MADINFDDYLFHASAFYKLVTEPKTTEDKKAGKVSKTTETELRIIYREVRHSRDNEFESKYTEKGIRKEEEAITLFCRLKKKVYKKNIVRVNNLFITGEPDLSDNEDIMKCQHGVDTKCSWSVFTMPYKDEKLPANYWWQDQCYMALTGAKRWSTAYCLVNAPADLILQEKKSVWYKLGMPEVGWPTYDLYIEKCQKLERNMIFNKAEFMAEEPGFDFDTKIWLYDIPLDERMVEFVVERDENAILKIKKTVIKCRKYLNDLNKLF